MELSEIVDIYCEAWSEISSDLRREKLKASVCDHVSYVDSSVVVSGIDDLEKHIAHTVRKRPGSFIRRKTQVDVHHLKGRFGWCLVDGNGIELPEGLDIVTFNADGKISHILGFFGPVNAI